MSEELNTTEQETESLPSRVEDFINGLLEELPCDGPPTRDQIETVTMLSRAALAAAVLVGVPAATVLMFDVQELLDVEAIDFADEAMDAQLEVVAKTGGRLKMKTTFTNLDHLPAKEQAEILLSASAALRAKADEAGSKIES